MNVSELFQTILLGGLLGMLGQSIRMLAGLKKLAESKQATGADSFDARRLTVSLFLGFVAGALGLLTTSDENWKQLCSQKSIPKELILTLIGIGYAGVDFLESLLTKFVPKPIDPPLPNPAAGAGPANPLAGGPNQPAAPTTYMQVPQLPYSSK
jgi:hypothetical protein